MNKTKYIDLNNNNFHRLKDSILSISFGDYVAIDLETTGLSFIDDDILLFSLYYNNISWVINVYNNDMAVKLIDFLLYIDKTKSPIWIGQNISFDLRMMYYKYYKYKLDNINNLDILDNLNGISYHRDMRVDMFTHIYCTFIVESKLFQGLDKKGSLEDISIFRLRTNLKKDVRSTFYSEESREKIQREGKFIPNKEQIIYTALDTILLPDIMMLQIDNLKEVDMYDFIFDVELEVINTLVELEVKGIRFDKEIWLKQIEINQQSLDENKGMLEAYIKEHFEDIDYSTINVPLYKSIGQANSSIVRLENAIVNKEQQLLTTNDTTKKHTSLVEGIERDKHKIVEYKIQLEKLEQSDKINWSSPKQLKALAYSIGMHEVDEIPMKKDGREYKFSMSKDVLSQWKINNPNSFYFEFIDLFSKYKKVESALSKTGLSWLEKFYHKEHPNLNQQCPKTREDLRGRVYTIYHQTKTDTGRLSSGDKNNGLVQTQNITSKGLYRNAFIANEGYKLMTIDWSGAELRIMEGGSKDQCIKYVREHLNGDSHSYVAQAVWRAIYKHRSEIEKNESKKKELEHLSNNLIVNSETNQDLRKAIKNTHFGILYGAHPRTVANALKVPLQEAEIAVKVVQQVEAEAYNYLKNSSIDTMLCGYTVTHSNIGTRKYNPIALNYLYNKGLLFDNERKELNKIRNNPELKEEFINNMLADIRKVNFLDAVSLDTQTRNLPIQGSQAEALKIYLSNFRKLRRRLHLEDKLSILLTVHDEVVHELPEYLAHISSIGKSLPILIEREMCDSADPVLNGFTKMTAEFVIEDYWVK